MTPDLTYTHAVYGECRRRASRDVMVVVCASPIGSDVYYPMLIEAPDTAEVKHDDVMAAFVACLDALAVPGTRIEIRAPLPGRNPMSAHIIARHPSVAWPKLGAVQVLPDDVPDEMWMSERPSPPAGAGYTIVSRHISTRRAHDG